MGLLQKLLSTLGLRESSGGRGSERAGETTVTVEHEPDTASESAVKGTETSTDRSAAGATNADAETAEADAGAVDIEEAEPDETGSGATEPEATESKAAESEVADTGATESDVAETDAAESEDDGSVVSEGADAETDSDAAADEDTGATATAGSDESPDVLNGIGPAYAERLENAGVETVGELANADAADLADETGLGEGRISNWIEQAKEY